LRNILAGLAVGLLAACSGGTAPVQQMAAATVAPPPISNVVAFMGDSITQMWDIPLNDPGPSINFGEDGEATTGMLLRFNNDVIASAPGVVVILGGIDDMAQYADGQTTAPPTIDSIKAMAAMAQAAGIKVIFCSVMPFNFAINPQPPTFSPSEIEAFNQQLIALAQANGYLYADYYDAMINSAGTQNTALFADYVHPNAAGYAVMWSVVAPLIDEDLK
jgi:lysophospholipase L1-like esterase